MWKEGDMNGLSGREPQSRKESAPHLLLSSATKPRMLPQTQDKL